MKNSKAAFGREDGVVWWIRFRDVLREGKVDDGGRVLNFSKGRDRVMDEKSLP